MSPDMSRERLAAFMAERLLAEPRLRRTWLRRLAAFLVRHRRTDQTDLLVNDIARQLQVQAGLLSLELTTARRLTPALRASLTEQLQQLTGTTAVSLHQTVDPGLRGGFIARTPNAELDASLSYGLRKLAAIA